MRNEVEMKVAAIVPAAGAGRRFSRATNKLFIRVGGQPLLAHTLQAIQAHPAIRWIVIPTQPADYARMNALLRRYRITKALPLCPGGASRAESVARGFAIAPEQADWILVHDGARPCVSAALLAQALRVAARHGAVACGLPANLTVKEADRRGRVRGTLDRDRLWFVQTPQVFRRDWFARALARANGTLSRHPDDASLIEAAGFPVRLIAGDPRNLKVTTADDVVIAETILKQLGGRRRRSSNQPQSG